MSRVFILNETDHDIRPAFRFGALVTIFGRTRPSIFDHNKFKKSFLDKVKELNFDPAIDSFICVGTAVPLVLATSFLQEEYGALRVLLFNAQSQDYVLRVLNDETSSKRCVRPTDEDVWRLRGTSQ
jgi:hypothetical protein